MSIRLEFLAEAEEFLAASGEHLARDPVRNSVVATLAERFCAGEKGQPDDWWLVVRDGSAVVGVGMRTAPFPPRPPFLLSMPDEAARMLARNLFDRDESMAGLNGALPTARVCAEESARLSGGTVRVAAHLRLFELRKVTSPPRPEGRLRPAGVADADLAFAWFAAFMADADDQAGRPPGSSPQEVPSWESVMMRIKHGWLWFWLNDAGEPVHLTSVNPVSFGAARLGLVYTPPEHRGRGFASATVADISQRILDQGARPCLFTDQANPTSNRIYQAIGYEAVTDMVNLVIS